MKLLVTRTVISALPRPSFKVRGRFMLALTLMISAVVPAMFSSPAEASLGWSYGDYLAFGKAGWDTTQSRLETYISHGYFDSYRAGSGNGNTDECVRSQGPLPDGWYSNGSLGHRDHYSGSAIYGRVMHLQDKQCWNGTWRTALFIHTEETSSQGQNSSKESQRWDGPSDYKSLGCIKLARSENGGDNGIGRMDSWFHYGVFGYENSVYSNVLYVWWL